MSLENLYKNVVKIYNDGEQGSGILYYPTKGEIELILTAKHVIKSNDASKITIDKLLNDDGSLSSIQLSEIADVQLLYCDDADLACIILPKGSLSILVENITNLEALDRTFDFKDCISLGYPHKNDGIKSINNKFRCYNEMPSYEIISKLGAEENLQTLSLDSYDNIRGMSGGGLFYYNGTNYYLSGILTDFKDGYKDFHSICLKKVNEFLVLKNISPIDVTFSTSFGLNEKYIANHLEKAEKALGERYTKAIETFEVPELEYFKYLDLGENFKELIGKQFSKFIRRVREYKHPISNHSFTKSFDLHIDKILSDIINGFLNVKWTVDYISIESYPIQIIDRTISTITEWTKQIEIEQLKIFEEQKLIENEKIERKIYKYNDEPLRDQAYSLRNLLDAFYEFKGYLISDVIKLSVNPVLIITGGAGKGKSHLLGDVAMKRLAEWSPSFLILGQQLGSANDPREQILGRLELTGKCTFTELLIQLNNIGECKGQRFFFIIDAINEGSGKLFWKKELSAFISEFKNYPWVALILSIRSIYIDEILPDDIKSSNEIVRIEHNGFQGQELEAVRHFCKCFGLKEPGVPLLSPEFTVPQFLLLICKALIRSGKHEFPKGINGISEIYDIYLNSVNSEIIKELNQNIPTSTDLVTKSINQLLSLGYARSYEYSKVEEVFVNFLGLGYLTLLNLLLKENILTEDIEYLSHDKPNVNVIRFSYERLAHHVFIKNKLNEVEQNVNTLFEPNGYIYDQYLNNYHVETGILESLAIQLPEKYNVELYEIITPYWLKPFQVGYKHQDEFNQIQGLVLDSIPWRILPSFDTEKIINFINDYLGGYSLSPEVFEIFITVSPIENHPLNARRLHKYLSQFDMPERDSFWIELTHNSFTEKKSALSRLIDWVLDYDEHIGMSSESRLLTCITLTWMLVSSDIALRDASTISIVKLLDEELLLSIDLLKLFEKIDDLYLQERLFASIYGAVIRSRKKDQIKQIADFVYKNIFSSGNLPIHILIRDYARGIIEYAIHLNRDSAYNLEVIRPPYGSKLPEKLSSQIDVEKKYKLKSVQGADYNLRYQIQGNNLIFDSLFGIWGDKNSINNQIKHFSQTPINYLYDFEKLKNELSLNQKKIIESIINEWKNMLKIEEKLNNTQLPNLQRSKIIELVKSKNKIDRFNKTRRDFEANLNNCKVKTEALFTELYTNPVLKNDRVETIIMTYLNNLKTLNRHHLFLNPNDFKPWTIQKLFELGYNNENHGKFDSIYIDHFRPSVHYKFHGKLERIGKKYERIARNELLARLTDNYMLRERWHNYELYYYDVPTFQLLSPKIDPSLIYYKKGENKENINNPQYNNWRCHDWLNVDDWPIPERNIIYFDENNLEWVCIYKQILYDEPKTVGDKDFISSKREMNYWIFSYIVNRHFEETVFEGLKSREYSDVWDWPRATERHEIIHGEYYWSRGYQLQMEIMEKENSGEFINSPISDVKVHVPIDEYYLSGIDIQTGLGHLKVSKLLFDGLGLDYIDDTGCGFNKNGDKIIRCSGRNVLWIRKDSLTNFLEENKLSIVWSVSGEKLDKDNSESFNYDSISRKYLIGTYIFDKNWKLKGERQIKN